jgi:hypothetical protein
MEVRRSHTVFNKEAFMVFAIPFAIQKYEV